MIGKTIAKLRKRKGATQEELAHATLVTTQAVSKWENGGAPDIELLPTIADFLGVSIDELFSRPESCGDLENALTRAVNALNGEQRFAAAHSLCWVLQRAIYGAGTWNPDTDGLDAMPDTHGVYSFTFRNAGIASMCLDPERPYFMLFPESESRTRALLQGESLVELFRLLADEDAFDALLLLHRRNGKPFTSALLEKQLGIAHGKAEEILRAFGRMDLVDSSELELDDKLTTIYSFNPNPAILTFLTAARELVNRPHRFTIYASDREFPLLR